MPKREDRARARGGREHLAPGGDRLDRQRTDGGLGMNELRETLNAQTLDSDILRSPWMGLIMSAESIRQVSEGTASSAILEKEKCEALVRMLRLYSASQLASILEVSEDFFGKEEEAMSSAAGPVMRETEPPGETSPSEVLMPLIKAAADAAALCAEHQGKYNSLKLARTIRLAHGADGNQIRYDRGDIQALDFHGLNVIHAKQLAALLTHLGLTPAHSAAWNHKDVRSLKLIPEPPKPYSSEARVRAKVSIQLNPAAKQFLDRVYATPQPLCGGTSGIDAPTADLPSIANATVLVGRDDSTYYKWALETESADGAEAFRHAVELLLLCGITEQQILDVILWHLHVRCGLYPVAEVRLDQVHSIMEIFDPDRSGRGPRARRGRLMIHMASYVEYDAIQEMMTRMDMDHTVFEIDHRDYFQKVLGDGVLNQVKLLQIPAPFALVLRDINKITQREKRSQACIALRVQPPLGMSTQGLVQSLVKTTTKGNGAAIEHGTSGTGVAGERCIADITQKFLDQHVLRRNDGGRLLPDQTPKVTVEITPSGGHEVGSNSQILILFEELDVGSEDSPRERDDDVAVLALQLAVFIANRSESEPYKQLRWCPFTGAGTGNSFCTLDRVTLLPGHGGGCIETRPWINLCADNKGGEKGTISWRMMTTAPLIVALVDVMRDTRDRPSTEGLTNLALCAGSSQRRFKEAVKALGQSDGKKPRLILGLPQAVSAQKYVDGWITYLNASAPAFLSGIVSPMEPYARAHESNLLTILAQRAQGQPTRFPFEGLAQIANSINWSIPTADGLQPVCCECREPYTVGTGLGYTRADLGRMHSAYAASGHEVALTERLNLLRSDLVAEMRNEVWGCNHCAHCVDKAVARRLDQVCSVPPQNSGPNDLNDLKMQICLTILAPLLTLRRWPEGGGKKRMTLSPPPLDEGRRGGDNKEDDDRHEKKRPNQDQDMDSTEVKGQTSHPQSEGGTRMTMQAGHPSSPAISPPMKADDGGPRTDLSALDSAPDPLEDIGQRRGDDDNMGAGKMKIDDGRPCGRAGALDPAPSQSGDNGPGQGQRDTMRVEKMTYPCPTRDGQPHVRPTARDEVLHYLGLSADTARPPGLPKSPPPCKGRRQQ